MIIAGVLVISRFLQWSYKFITLGSFMSLSFFRLFLNLNFLQLEINYMLQKIHNVFMFSFNMFTDLYCEYWGYEGFFILKHFIF